MDEPDLDIDDIQGHVLVGFGGGYQTLVGLQMHPATLEQARTMLLNLVPDITSSRATAKARARRRETGETISPTTDPNNVALTISFSYEGLRLLGAFEGPEDIHFRRGAASDALDLKDDVDQFGSPTGWSVGATNETTPHVFIVMGGTSLKSVADYWAKLGNLLQPIFDVVFYHEASRLEGEREHFGFVDGISQPGPRGKVDGSPLIERSLPSNHLDYEYFARPGQPLVWPGQYIFGYPVQEPDSAEAGPIAGGDNVLLKNGSILVFRKLRQDVSAFNSAMTKLAADFSAAGFPATGQLAAAWCVGRWPNGTPVNLSPMGEDQDISKSTVRRNGFLYRSECPATSLNIGGVSEDFPGAVADRFGYSSPFFSHIRKVNPRDMPVDQGGANITLRSQMLRRGVPYGPKWSHVTDEVDRGLMFMSYQTSIENQFYRLMTLWVNNTFAPPPTGQGIDPLIGAPQGGRALTRRPLGNKNYTAVLPGRWVITTGAGYFFTPGIAGYRLIVKGT